MVMTGIGIWWFFRDRPTFLNRRDLKSFKGSVHAEFSIFFGLPKLILSCKKLTKMKFPFVSETLTIITDLYFGKTAKTRPKSRGEEERSKHYHHPTLWTVFREIPAKGSGLFEVPKAKHFSKSVKLPKLLREIDRN